jgi:cytochrome c553
VVVAFAMSNFAKGMTDAEIRDVADYYAGLKPIPWTRITESEASPKSIVSRNNRRVRLLGNDTEAVGSRIIEIGINRVAIRQFTDPAFVAFVPPGMIEAGKELVQSGGNEKTKPCADCHGEGSWARERVPIIAALPDLYRAPDLQFKGGLRKRPTAEIMKDAVAKLSDDAVIAVSSYVASLNPF